MRQPKNTSIGARMTYVRAKESQRGFAERLGVPVRTYQNYESDKREPDVRTLIALYGLGWNLNWLLTAEGHERLDSLQTAPSSQSQALRPEELTVAVQLAQEALDGDTLDPPEYAQLVSLIYDALVHGLPSAQVIALARPAARGLNHRGSKDGKSVVGGSG